VNDFYQQVVGNALRSGELKRREVGH